MNTWLSILFIGLGATLLADAWAFVRQKILSVPSPNFALVGRWIAYMPTGKFVHHPITKSPAVKGEGFIGWSAHYLIGVTFAAGLVSVFGEAWLSTPSLWPALITGAVTVAAPFFLMQPGMGSGLAASKTPKPNQARLHSLVYHLVFGVGLYLSAKLLNTMFNL